MDPLWAECMFRVALGDITEWERAGVDGSDPAAVRDWVARSLAGALDAGMTVTVEERHPVPMWGPDTLREWSGRFSAAFDLQRYRVETNDHGDIEMWCPEHGMVVRSEYTATLWTLVGAAESHRREEH